MIFSSTPPPTPTTNTRFIFLTVINLVIFLRLYLWKSFWNRNLITSRIHRTCLVRCDRVVFYWRRRFKGFCLFSIILFFFSLRERLKNYLFYSPCFFIYCCLFFTLNSSKCSLCTRDTGPISWGCDKSVKNKK